MPLPAVSRSTVSSAWRRFHEKAVPLGELDFVNDMLPEMSLGMSGLVVSYSWPEEA